MQGCFLPGLCKAWREKIPQRSEDDFFPANPNGAWPCSIQRQGARFAVRKRNMDYNTMLLFINLKKNYFSRLYT
ncbi:hypothetical protein DXD78_06160 [Bacteroides sp. D20]|nr:hypothetical protein DXD78_06160 [Bacteroides sp. D20]